MPSYSALLDLTFSIHRYDQLANDLCTLGTPCAGYTWCPSFASYLFNLSIDCLINIYIRCFCSVDTRYKEVQYDTCPQLNFSQRKSVCQSTLCLKQNFLSAIVNVTHLFIYSFTQQIFIKCCDVSRTLWFTVDRMMNKSCVGPALPYMNLEARIWLLKTYPRTSNVSIT